MEEEIHDGRECEKKCNLPGIQVEFGILVGGCVLTKVMVCWYKYN